ncbi:hypothetical protein [Clostridium cellulovorans]|uniref:hypothetical protein n=1 Tax=Clostridium cellulovorans TaxID=1493 RepID=UPI0001A97001|nr:hypothetical protein [Clostridium cellulovorans]
MSNNIRTVISFLSLITLSGIGVISARFSAKYGTIFGFSMLAIILTIFLFSRKKR